MFQLANLPTPIQTWKLPGVPEGFEVFVKWDDMTGSTLSGNKVCIMPGNPELPTGICTTTRHNIQIHTRAM